jgi:hypothetical protein
MAGKNTTATPPEASRVGPHREQTPQPAEQPTTAEPMQYMSPSKQKTKGGTTFGLSEIGFGEQTDMTDMSRERGPKKKGKKRFGRVNWCWCCEQCYEYCCD